MFEENSVRTTVFMDKSVHRGFRVLAAQQDSSMQALISQALDEWLQVKLKEQGVREGALGA